MKANELRIGNLVYLVDKEKIWEILDGHEIDECDDNPFAQPIPLTEEWLLKLGFVSNPFQDRYEKGQLHIECAIKKGKTYLWIESMPHIKHVHQLQNLYFALTGEELTYGGGNK